MTKRNLTAAIEIRDRAEELAKDVGTNNPGAENSNPVSPWAIRQTLAGIIVLCSKLRVELGEDEIKNNTILYLPTKKVAGGVKG